MRFIPLAALAALLLPACMSTGPSVMRVAPSDRPATVDPAEAVATINAYRHGQGLPPVRLNPTLSAVAARHARAMADADKLAHVLPGEGSFPSRLTAGGYDAAVAVENIGAGHHSLSDAFSGWRASPSHRKNMLDKRVTEMGIAVAYSGESKFKDFWSLVLAAPDE